MANNNKVMGSIKDFLLKLQALDEAIPEELAEDALEMTNNVKDALCEVDEEPDVIEKKEEEDEEPEKESIEDTMVKVLRKYGVIKDSSMSALDELEEKMEEDEDGEEEVTVDPEKMNKDSARAILREVKPIISSVKDSKQRKQLSDAFAKALNMPTGNSYGSITRMAAASARTAADEAMHRKTTDADYDFGMEIAKKFNPHYNKEVN